MANPPDRKRVESEAGNEDWDLGQLDALGMTFIEEPFLNNGGWTYQKHHLFRNRSSIMVGGRTKNIIYSGTAPQSWWVDVPKTSFVETPFLNHSGWTYQKHHSFHTSFAKEELRPFVQTSSSFSVRGPIS